MNKTTLISLLGPGCHNCIRDVVIDVDVLSKCKRQGVTSVIPWFVCLYVEKACELS